MNTVASYRENYVSAASGAYTNRLSPNWQGLRQTYDAIRAYSENLLEVRQLVWLFGLYHERWPDAFLFSFPERGRGCPSEGFARESRVPEDSSGFSPFSRFWRPPHAVGWNHWKNQDRPNAGLRLPRDACLLQGPSGHRKHLSDPAPHPVRIRKRISALASSFLFSDYQRPAFQTVGAWVQEWNFFLRQNSKYVWSVQEHAWQFEGAGTQAIRFVTCQYLKWPFHRASSRQKQERYSCYIGIYLHGCWPCPRWSPYNGPTVDSGCIPAFWGVHAWYFFRSAPLWFGSHERESLRPYTDVQPFLPLACLPSDRRHNRHVLFPLLFFEAFLQNKPPDSPSIASGDLPL